jgi:hypothetical protein
MIKAKVDLLNSIVSDITYIEVKEDKHENLYIEYKDRKFIFKDLNFPFISYAEGGLFRIEIDIAEGLEEMEMFFRLKKGVKEIRDFLKK